MMLLRRAEGETNAIVAPGWSGGGTMDEAILVLQFSVVEAVLCVRLLGINESAPWRGYLISVKTRGGCWLDVTGAQGDALGGTCCTCCLPIRYSL